MLLRETNSNRIFGGGAETQDQKEETKAEMRLQRDYKEELIKNTPTKKEREKRQAILYII